MKVSKSIAVIGVAVSLCAGSVYADDFNSVINVEQADRASANVSHSIVNPNVTIQDYVDAANEAANVKSKSVASNSSRWNAEKTL